MNSIKVDKLPTIRRLPEYLRILRNLACHGKGVVSSGRLAEAMNIDPILVRKDLAMTGIEGTPRLGYKIPDLIAAIEELLGWGDASMDAFLVGVGHLGTAILGYQELSESGHRILAAFDKDPEKIGLTVHGIRVSGLDELPELVSRMKVHVAILTVPPGNAQEAADFLAKSGIQGIWNFTTVSLEVPEGVVTHKEDLMAGLAVLSVKLARVTGRPLGRLNLKRK